MPIRDACGPIEGRMEVFQRTELTEALTTATLLHRPLNTLETLLEDPITDVKQNGASSSCQRSDSP